MSYILDALKKAEHERRTEEPLLDLQLPHQADVAEQKTHLWGIAIGINLLLILILLWQQFFNQPITSPAPPVLPLVQNPKITVSENIVSLPKNPAPPIIQPTIIFQVDKAKLAKQALEIPKEVPKKITAPQAPEKSLEKPAEPEKEVAKILPTKIPFLHELSSQLQASIPNLEINAHVYAKQINKRFVLINGRRYSENTYIQTNLQLQAIRPTDIVLKYKKQLFKIRVGN